MKTPVRKRYSFVGICLLLLLLTACNYFTYTPRSKANIMHERPSFELLSRIVQYRELRNNWPTSREDFTGLGQPFADAFKNFPYVYTRFKIIDSNTMIFYFSEHIKDLQTISETGQSELNKYHGRVRFFKVKDRFTWRLKMK